MIQVAYGSIEFYEMLKDFDKMKMVRGRYDKEDRSEWDRGRFYQDGNVNEAFKVFLSGCNYGIMLSNLDNR